MGLFYSFFTKKISEPDAEAENETEVVTETSTTISIAGEVTLQTFTLFIQDERLPGGTTEWTLDGPLTISQLREKASVSSNIFVIKFPNQGNQIAYIDTVQYVLRYREETVSPHNLAVGVRFELNNSEANGTVDKGRRPPMEVELTWSLLVYSDRYLTVTPSTLLTRSRTTKRKLEFEKFYPGIEKPVWVAGGIGTLLTFKNTVTEENQRTDWFTAPIQTDKGENEMSGSTTSMNSIHVFHVRGVNANNLPWAPILPAMVDEN